MTFIRETNIQIRNEVISDGVFVFEVAKALR